MLCVPWTKQAADPELMFGNGLGNPMWTCCNTAQTLSHCNFGSSLATGSLAQAPVCAGEPCLSIALLLPVSAGGTRRCLHSLPAALQLWNTSWSLCVRGALRAAATRAKPLRSSINQERSKELQDLSLARWLSHDLSCTKTFWVVSWGEKFQISWSKSSVAGGQEASCSVGFRRSLGKAAEQMSPVGKGG